MKYAGIATSNSFSVKRASWVKSLGWWWRILTLSPLLRSSASGTPSPVSSSTTSGRRSYLQSEVSGNKEEKTEITEDFRE